MNCILKIARSPKSNKVYGLFDLNYCKIFMDVDDVVKLTGISYSDLQCITIEQPWVYEVNIQTLSK